MKLKKAIGYTLAAIVLALTVYMYSTMPWYAILLATGGGAVAAGTILLVYWLLKEDKEGEDDH